MSDAQIKRSSLKKRLSGSKKWDSSKRLMVVKESENEQSEVDTSKHY